MMPTAASPLHALGCFTRGMPDEEFRSGAVTRIGTSAPAPPPDILESGNPDRPGLTSRQRLWVFLGAAVAIVVVGVIAIAVARPSGGVGLFTDRPEAPTDARPPLARACPAPATAQAAPEGPAPAPPAKGRSIGRAVDREAGISYAEYGEPWVPWNAVWNAGTLEVPYKVGQHFVTEPAYDGFSDYHASILSAAVPAANNDSYAFDLECVGRQVAADARAEYYPQPNEMQLIRDEQTTLGGRPAWVSVFRLHFKRSGLKATSELVGIACIDVGKPTAAVLYISIPSTHTQYDWVVEDTLTSMRPV
jgi:hypothetical protein